MTELLDWEIKNRHMIQIHVHHQRIQKYCAKTISKQGKYLRGIYVQNLNQSIQLKKNVLTNLITQPSQYNVNAAKQRRSSKLNRNFQQIESFDVLANANQNSQMKFILFKLLKKDFNFEIYQLNNTQNRTKAIERSNNGFESNTQLDEFFHNDYCFIKNKHLDPSQNSDFNLSQILRPQGLN
ncbi:unnamed protein product [Paramecium octaurelia]|uniref:Uncharacterized protein n=1 Tax=Paramecium octaurelia TaxID=43137 RepID=A0A8S1YEI7_PAROT|nr:unnamed protein product [Paramecium octaurelia]